MSNNRFLNHPHPNKKPKLQEPSAFDEAPARNQWPGNLEWPLAPETTSMVNLSNFHLHTPLQSSGTQTWQASRAAVMSAPRGTSSSGHGSADPIIQSHHGTSMGQLALFPPYQALGPPNVVPTVEASRDLAGTPWSRHQRHYETTEGALGQKAASWGLTEAQLVANYSVQCL